MANTLRFYNTLTRSLEPFQPQNPPEVRIYTCGPTVYNYAHIGNFRTYLFEDVLRRTLKSFGYHVNQVMNLTDVDDKTIKGALKRGCSLDDYTEPYKKAFFDDLKTLCVEPVEHYPAATDYIPQMIQMIQKLIEKKVAYQGLDGCVYYAIDHFPKYGCLSHLHLDELKAGASERVASDEYDKDNVADFVLWKAYDPDRDGGIYWESPFGKGRPGWHLECSAMAMDILGETLDIHVGGVDNMFPHHENEIAQSEAISGKTFSKLWMHSEHLVVDNKKMSKSLGNFFTLRDLLDKGFTGTEVRYLLIQTHYKTRLNFTLSGLEAARSSLQRLQAFIHRLQTFDPAIERCPDCKNIINQAEDQFYQALADDLNMSQALAALFDLVREINSYIDDKQLGMRDVDSVLELLHRMNQILNVMEFSAEENVPDEVLKALEERNAARKNKQWDIADAKRDFIHNEGYEIEDTPKGSFVKKRAGALR